MQQETNIRCDPPPGGPTPGRGRRPPCPHPRTATSTCCDASHYPRPPGKFSTTRGCTNAQSPRQARLTARAKWPPKVCTCPRTLSQRGRTPLLQWLSCGRAQGAMARSQRPSSKMQNTIPLTDSTLLHHSGKQRTRWRTSASIAKTEGHSGNTAMYGAGTKHPWLLNGARQCAKLERLVDIPPSPAPFFKRAPRNG